MAPLKEHNEKLQAQINEFFATLRARETKINQQAKRIQELKSMHQHLQEDYDSVEKKLHQRSNHVLKCETEKRRLQSRNLKLTDEVHVSTQTL